MLSRDQYQEHRERLRRRMGTEDGGKSSKRRKYTVGPRIGHLSHDLGVRRFLRRGIEKVQTEWIMVCSAVILRLFLPHWDEVVTTL